MQKEDKAMIDNKFSDNYDKMAEEIYTLVNKGMTREQAAVKFNYENIRSMDQLMRRRGYKVFNNKYVKDERNNKICVISVKAERIMNELNKAEREKIEITGTQLHRWGFDSRQQLNDYMRKEGVGFDPINKQYYVVPTNELARSHDILCNKQHTESNNAQLSSKENLANGTLSETSDTLQKNNVQSKSIVSESSQYTVSANEQIHKDVKSDALQMLEKPDASEHTEVPHDISDLLPFIQFLYNHRDVFNDMIQEKNEFKPHTVTIPGKCVQKTFHLNRNLACLINEFADEHGMRHKQVVEAAVVEYLEKYGYLRQVELIKHRN